MKSLILLVALMASPAFAGAEYGLALLKEHKGRILTKGDGDVILVPYCKRGMAYLKVKDSRIPGPRELIGSRKVCMIAFWQLEKIGRETERKIKPNKVLETYGEFVVDEESRASASVEGAPSDLGNITQRDETIGKNADGTNEYMVTQPFHTATIYSHEEPVRVKRGHFNRYLENLE